MDWSRHELRTRRAPHERSRGPGKRQMARVIVRATDDLPAEPRWDDPRVVALASQFTYSQLSISYRSALAKLEGRGGKE